MKLHHRSNGNYLCVCVKYVQYNAGSTGTTAEGFCEIGDFVLFSYQMVSHGCSSIRSAAFVWLRPERWLVYIATQSYRICRKNVFFPLQLRALRSSLLVTFFTPLA